MPSQADGKGLVSGELGSLWYGTLDKSASGGF